MQFITKTGRVLTDADFEALANEAQQGWTEVTDAERAEALQFALRVMIERVKRTEAELVAAQDRYNDELRDAHIARERVEAEFEALRKAVRLLVNRVDREYPAFWVDEAWEVVRASANIGTA